MRTQWRVQSLKHWLSYRAQNLLLQGRLPTEGWVDIPLKEVVERRSMHDTWSLNDIPEGRIEMELQWLPVLEEAA